MEKGRKERGRDGGGGYDTWKRHSQYLTRALGARVSPCTQGCHLEHSHRLHRGGVTVFFSPVLNRSTMNSSPSVTDSLLDVPDPVLLAF
jgi:hypothetical protein